MKNNIKPILDEYIDKNSKNHVYGVTTFIHKISTKIIKFFNKRIIIERCKIEYIPVNYITDCKQSWTKQKEIEDSNNEINKGLQFIKDNSIICFNIFNNIININITNKPIYDTKKVKEIIDNIILE